MVLGISELRKKANPPSNPVQGSKLLVVVLRTDNPSPETDLALPEDFQSDKIEAGYVYASAVALEVGAEAGKKFKVTLEALDKEIARFDSTPSACAETLFPLGPLMPGLTYSCPYPNLISPLANITNSGPL
nr:hypothetical protein CFP56_01775 [Quercus suber]